MSANDSGRYIVRIEVFAAADHIDLDQARSNSSPNALEEVLRDLKQANPNEIEDRTYRQMRYDLCDRCRRSFLIDPLGG